MQDMIVILETFYTDALLDAGDNYQSNDQGNVERNNRKKLSSKGYGSIRETLAKKGLDELSRKFGRHFPLSVSFDATMKSDNTRLVMETVLANNVQYNGSPFSAGRKAFTSTYGVKTSVHIKQMEIDAELYANAATESIYKAIGRDNEQSTLDVIPCIKEILSNSVLMGVERIVHTEGKGMVLYGYRLYNLYWYNDGKAKISHCLACTVVQKLDKAEGYVFQNIENVTIDRGLPGTEAGMSSSVNDDEYTIAQLHRAVKKIDRLDGGLKYTASERNRYLFDYTEHNDGVKFSTRDSVGRQLTEVEHADFRGKVTLCNLPFCFKSFCPNIRTKLKSLIINDIGKVYVYIIFCP